MIIALIFLCLFSLAFQQDPYAELRDKMVDEQIKARGIAGEKVLSAMRKVPRHLFVNKEFQHLSYSDQALPIHYDQTISQPYIVGYMTDALDLDSGDKVLEIGTGSGYQAAVLAEIVKEVYTVEIISGLALEAREKLESLNYANVHVKAADGFDGWKEHAPYDAIIVTAAAEEIPPPLIEQLKEGGKMIIPKGAVFSVQNLVLLTKRKDSLRQEKLIPVRFVPFTREEK